MSLSVVKCGGAALSAEAFDLSRHVPAGAGVVVVHGAGPRITRALRTAGITTRFVDGRRVTTREAMPHVRAAFRAENRDLCRLIGHGAVGLMGDELGLEADRVEELGEVGLLRPTVPATLWRLLATDAIPVIAPLARGPLNVNADDAAAVLATALRADRLVFVSDVPGVLVRGEPLPVVSQRDSESLRDELSGGILPKLQAALHAARSGLRVHIGETEVVAESP